MATDTASYEHALALFAAGDFEASHAAALELLRRSPHEPAFLRLAGRAAVELGRPEAAELLQQAAAADPGSAEAWQDLADALLAEGRLTEARQALLEAVERRPDDADLQVDLAHVEHASGERDQAIARLERTLELDPTNVAALRGLGGMYEAAGRLDDALGCRRAVLDSGRGDALTALDAAELALRLDRLPEAGEAFRSLRTLDDEPEHEIYAFHGLIEVEVRRERWRQALDLAIDATRVDRFGRTTDVLAYLVAQVFGQGGRPAPERSEIDEALALSRAEHRRLHADLDV
jgi:tetratricopeptide (TPR) repeat protein